MVKNLSRLWVFALLVAWGFDFLFWEKVPGVSFAVFVVICLLPGFVLAYGEKLRPARSGLLLLLPIGFFAVMSFIWQEWFTQSMNYLFTLGLMAILAGSFLTGRWFSFGAIDYLLAVLQLTLSVIVRPVMAWSARRSDVVNGDNLPRRISAWKQTGPVLRGLALALPVVVLFAALLSSADLVFSHSLEQFLRLLRIENLSEYIFRLFYILVLGYAFAGVYLHALTASRDETVKVGARPVIPPFLGFTEAITVVGSVDLLFAFFVVIQFRYFFGGQANIHIAGYTYAEYARRGFGELVVVAFLSLLLFLGLSAIAQRESPAQKWTFSALGIGLVALVMFILASAFQRLVLYERAYGFTGLRTSTHIFIIWLGILLLAVIGLEVAGRLRLFTLVAVLAALGFGTTLNLLNVDKFIVRQNIARARAGYKLDIDYLGRLSTDSFPALAQAFTASDLPESQRDGLGAILACRAAQITDQGEIPWQSFTLSRYRADQSLHALQSALSAFPVRRNENGSWVVKVNGEEQDCFPDYGD
jgi:hypothetical protein